jgi:hypothetical protein
MQHRLSLLRAGVCEPGSDPANGQIGKLRQKFFTATLLEQNGTSTVTAGNILEMKSPAAIFLERVEANGKKSPKRFPSSQ